MTNKPVFRCHICEQPAENPYLSLDWRIEKVAVVTHDGKPVTSINIAERESLLIYCSHACWQAHESIIAEALELQHTYPAFSFVTPCCRCGKAVNRTQLYVCYSISEMSVTGNEVLIGHCIDDHDFAVLCRECEEPELSAAEGATNETMGTERASA